jgi:hypothetical protein
VASFEPEPVAAPFEPPPPPPEEPVQIATSDLDAPAPPEVASTPEPIASTEGSDPLTREQS